MTFDRSKREAAKIPTSLEQGDFTAEGRWNPAAQAIHRGPRYRFVQSLIRARQAAHLSPAQIAEQIEASHFAGMFGELANWATITAWYDWAHANTRTSADSAVKYCGI